MENRGMLLKGVYELQKLERRVCKGELLKSKIIKNPETRYNGLHLSHFFSN